MSGQVHVMWENKETLKLARQMEATDNAAVLSLLKVNFKETMQNFAHWRQLNKRKKKSKINN